MWTNNYVHDMVAILGHDLISQDIGAVDTASYWLIENLDMVM